VVVAIAQLVGLARRAGNHRPLPPNLVLAQPRSYRYVLADTCLPTRAAEHVLLDTCCWTRAAGHVLVDMSVTDTARDSLCARRSLDTNTDTHANGDLQ
jgi:hypothetical protein